MWKDRREVAIERREKGRPREMELRGQRAWEGWAMDAGMERGGK